MLEVMSGRVWMLNSEYILLALSEFPPKIGYLVFIVQRAVEMVSGECFDA